MLIIFKSFFLFFIKNKQKQKVKHHILKNKKSSKMNGYGGGRVGFNDMGRGAPPPSAPPPVSTTNNPNDRYRSFPQYNYSSNVISFDWRNLISISAIYRLFFLVINNIIWSFHFFYLLEILISLKKQKNKSVSLSLVSCAARLVKPNPMADISNNSRRFASPICV